MKTKYALVTLAAAGLLLAAPSCIKKVDPPQGGGTTGGSTDGGTPRCLLLAKGTIEVCPLNPDLWFINATYFPFSNNSNPPARLLLPASLPQSFRVNGLTVSFDYTELGDSAALDCWRCGTPRLYGHKVTICNIRVDSNVVVAYKPVIYLYPDKTTKVKVELNYKGRLTVTYPEYSDALHGWEVIAQKDGSLKNLSDQTEHQYLFWEGIPTVPYKFNMREGFCVRGSDTRAFLQKTLPQLGLTPKEYNDMIVFWLPKMINNPYNLIHFAESAYTESAPLKITPQPDQVIRVFMAYQPCRSFIKTTEPVLMSPRRKGFTVVEWGGTEYPAFYNETTPSL